MSLLSEMPEGEADDRIEPCESADIMQQSDNNAIPILHNTDRRVEIGMYVVIALYLHLHVHCG